MTKLRLIRCKIQNGQIVEEGSKSNRIDKEDDYSFDVTINPDKYSHSFGITYSGAARGKDRALGKSGTVAKFANVESEKVSFEIVLDGTGVVPGTKGLSVAERIEKLREVAYTYKGEKHEPPIVNVVWGNGLKAFYGRLTSLTTNYTLFQYDGTALRARLNLSFISAKTEKEEALESGDTSPDLTHLVQVKAGDTLPLLCDRIYSDASKYIEVARFNNLDGFRVLEPGAVLRFPPMR